MADSSKKGEKADNSVVKKSRGKYKYKIGTSIVQPTENEFTYQPDDHMEVKVQYYEEELMIIPVIDNTKNRKEKEEASK